MWRITLFIGLLCSVALNVYLFLQLNVRTIENKFQQEVSIYKLQSEAKTTKNKLNTLDKDNYSVGTKKFPKGPANGKFKVLRGGSWINFPDSLRSAFRRWSQPDVRFNDTGFRCAKDSKQFIE